MSDVSAITMRSILMGLQRIREESNELPISILITLLGVAIYTPAGDTQQELSILELSKKVGIPYSTTSRHLRYLGKFQYPGKPGLGLVDTGEMVMDRRQKYVVLTPKGQRFVAQVFTLMGVKA